MKKLLVLCLLICNDSFAFEYHICKSQRIISFQGVSCWYNLNRDPDVIDITSSYKKIEPENTVFGGSNSYSDMGIHDDENSVNGLMTGKRGGKYYINENGNKTYVPRK